MKQGARSASRVPARTAKLLAGRSLAGRPLALSGVLRRTAAVVACMVLAACSSSSGKEPAGAHPTIVSLNPCSDATLAEITAPGQLLAVSHYSFDEASSSMGVAAAERFGAASGAIEEIVALRPDMVVADIFLPPATRQALDDLGIRVVTIGSTDTIDSSIEQIRQLARETGNVEQGEKLVRGIEHAIARHAPPRDAPAVSAVVWESGGIVAGDDTLIADLLRHTGFVNAAAARGLGQADYLPLEAILADPPDVIIAAGDLYSQENRLLTHPALRVLTSTGHAAFDSTLLWCGGPTIIRATRHLAGIRRSVEPVPGHTRAGPEGVRISRSPEVSERPEPVS